MAGTAVAKKRASAERGTTTKVAVKKSAMKKRGHRAKAVHGAQESVKSTAPQKNAFEEKFGEGTAFDLDYGKLLIIGLCAYIAIKVS